MNASPAPTVSTTFTCSAATFTVPAAHTAKAPVSPIVTATTDGPSPSHVWAICSGDRFGSIQCMSSSLALTTSAAFDEAVDAAPHGVGVLDSAGRTFGIERDRRRRVIGVQQRRGGPATRFQPRRDGPGVRHQRRRHLRRARQLPIEVEHVLRRAGRVQRGQRGRCAHGGVAARNQLHPRGFDIVGDAVPACVGADVGEEVDAAAQPGQAHRHVERAAADMLAGDLAVALDDVDQRLTDDQGPLRAAGRAHDDSSRNRFSSVARAPSRCNDSSAQR